MLIEDKSNYVDVFSACLGKMMVIQQNASDDIVRGRDWNVDFSKGLIFFGEDSYPIQLIGTESNQSNTWNWGWNNVNHLPDSQIKLASHILELGQDYQLDPLTVAQFELNEMFNGHNLSIIACGLSEDQYFYYRCPHSGGAIFVAIEHHNDKLCQSINIQEFANLTMQCIQQFPVNHKIFVESLLEWNKTKYEWNNLELIAHFSTDLYITFEKVDQYYRMISMNTKNLSNH